MDQILGMMRDGYRGIKVQGALMRQDFSKRFVFTTVAIKRGNFLEHFIETDAQRPTIDLGAIVTTLH
jgi:hypothetical protein